MSALAKGDKLPGLAIPAVGQAEIEAYLVASGDDNPLHRDRDIALSVGLADIPIPGMMIMAYTAECVRQWSRCRRLTGLSLRFVRPALVGGGLAIEGKVIDVAADAATLRLTATQDGRIAAIAEARLLVDET